MLDMDSIISSIALGFYLSLFPSTKQNENLKNKLILPVFNINQQEIKLRKDCKYVLERFLSSSVPSNQVCNSENIIQGLDTQYPGIFIDELNSAEGKVEAGVCDNLDIYLVDHNQLSAKNEGLRGCVRGVVDHHLDEKAFLESKIRVIENVGSCTSAIVLMIKERLEEIGCNGSCEVLSSEFLMSLLAPIMLDTSNLANSKVTQMDIEATKWIQSILSSSTFSLDTDFEKGIVRDNSQIISTVDKSRIPSEIDAFYSKIKELKKDVSDFSSIDLMNKDYKQIVAYDEKNHTINLGISSVPLRLKKWIKKRGPVELNDAISAFLKQKNLNIYIVMTMGNAKDDEGIKSFGRELTVYFGNSVSPTDETSFTKSLLSNQYLDLVDFKSIKSQDKMDRTYYFQQLYTNSSRKQVFPIVNDVVSRISFTLLSSL
ncbi:putative exopolyphosphatase [Zancudomyces culisetae]|uniref:Putative exopolyphosphatase n=1 Tax=Zancudomyces culisetae TaxID=1213189 RepID=A0A1R1PZ10_ZANCU|nr:putative exopolyphosphatase [Zancudomyces culisetae]|eukprot:OMH86202.1 putative exopolyphosphatase [Zancudomyces culisetae]